MKQRLLLALLVLFASVGLANAQTSVDENGLVTLNVSAGKTFTVKFDGGAPVSGAISLSANVTSVNTTGNTWTFNSGLGGSLSFYGGTYTTLEIGQGPTAVSFSEANGGNTYNFIRLDELVINPGILYSISGYEKLTHLMYFECTGNKLRKIPSKLYFPKGSDKDFIYKVGTQSPDGIIITGSAVPSSEQCYLTLDKICYSSITAFTDINHPITDDNKVRVSYSNWQEKNNNGVAKVDNVASYIYRFVERATSSVFANAGEYTCILKTSSDNTQFPNVTINNVTVKVANAQFKPIITNATVDYGRFNVYNGTVTDANKLNPGVSFVNKNDYLIIVSAPETGYQLTKDQIITKGLTYIEDKDGQFKYQVIGDVTPEITTSYTSVSKVITIAPAPNGTVKVLYDGKEVKTGESVPYGAKVEIVPTPNKDYKVNSVMHDNEYIYCNRDGKYITTITNATNQIVGEFIPVKIREVIVNYIEDGVTFFEATGLTYVGDVYRKEFAEQYKGAEGTPVTFKVRLGHYDDDVDEYIEIDPQTVTIIANGVKLPLQKTENPYEFMISYTIPAADVEIFTTIKELESVKIMLLDGQEKNYTGSPIAPDYIVAPADLKDITISHKQAAASVWTAGLPTNNGTYIVKLERLSDEVYDNATVEDFAGHLQGSGSGCVAFKINKVAPEVKTIPTYRKVFNNTTHECTYVAINEGVVTFNGKVIDGKFEIVDGDDDVPFAEALLVCFTPTDPNFKDVYMTTDALGVDPINGGVGRVDMVKITTGKLPENATLKIYNGTKQITSAYNEVPEGTILTLKGNINDYRFTDAISFVAVDQNGNKDEAVTLMYCNEDGTPIVPPTTSTDSIQYIRVINTNNLNLGLELKAATGLKEFALKTISTVSFNYDGTSRYFSRIWSLKEKALGADDATAVDLSTAGLLSNFKVTYTDQDGKAVISPRDAGRYTAKIECVKMERGYKYPFEATNTFEIKPIAAPITNRGEVNGLTVGVTAAPISIGQTLSQAQLFGPADCEGHYEWAHPDYKVTTPGISSYEVVFVPADTRNYTSVNLQGKVNVEVLNKALITFAPVNGKVEVKDFTGKLYNSGDIIPVGTSLMVNAVPNEGYKLKSLKVGETTVQTSPYIFTFPDATVEVKVEFEKTTRPVDPTPTPDPDPTKAILVFPSEISCTGKGYRISNYGAISVSYKSDYRFTVSTASGDKKNVIVLAGEQVVPANIDGSYTVKADADKAISVILSDPSKIYVDVVRTTKNAKGYTVGTVEVNGLDSNNTCYYGDKIILLANPVDGIQFEGWSDAITNKSKLREIEVKDAMTIKALFTGVPTGIETIETAQVYGADQCIVIRGLAEANVTIISMDGRTQKQQISGDTRIDAVAGIYGVIIEAGKEVLKTKVIVR